MQIRMITSSDKMWNSVMEYAESCTWSAGKYLANDMKNNFFSGWERVIISLKKEDICGYCTVAKTDCISDVPYTPYIGYIFVGEQYRGNRISQQMIEFAKKYLKSIGFDRVHIVSDHENLYEKYGFTVIDRKIAPWGEVEKIYMQTL